MSSHNAKPLLKLEKGLVSKKHIYEFKDNPFPSLEGL